MKKRVVIVTFLIGSITLGGLFWPPGERLIWNRTASAPIGLYWLNDAPLHRGEWVVVSAKSADAQWAERHGFVGKDWPLLKQIVGVPGDEICRLRNAISINGNIIGMAKESDRLGRDLPRWEGCSVLGEGELFLMNSHPDSLDGRYFGAVDMSDLDGVAVLILEY